MYERKRSDETAELEEFFARLFAKADAAEGREAEWGDRPAEAHGPGRCETMPNDAGTAMGGRSPLRFTLEPGPDGRIRRKRECVDGRDTVWDYAYDADGRLVHALRDGRVVEEYAYDRAGRRVAARTEATGPQPVRYAYEGEMLLRAGNEAFAYARGGALSSRLDATGVTRFLYEPGGGLGRVDLPDGQTVTYMNNDLGQPVEKFVNGRRAERFRWLDPLRLAAYRDQERGLTLRFRYGPARLPHSVVVADARGERTYRLGCDQVGTLKSVADEHGRLIQTIQYDSFGSLLRDDNPGLFIPLGFAGGLRDRHTGLVRMVRRDYDPRIGRFTAPDPLGDTGGDHDRFEYCVDDPVNAVDPRGEFPFALPLSFLAGKGLAAGIAALGLTAASQAVGNPEVKVKVGGKETKTSLNKAALAGVAASKVPDAAVAGALAAPEAVPLLARGGAALKEAATKAETAANNAAVNAFGKAANVAGKVSPKAGEMVLKPTIYNAAKDALTSYTPAGTLEPSYGGIVGSSAGAKDQILDWIETIKNKNSRQARSTEKTMK